MAGLCASLKFCADHPSTSLLRSYAQDERHYPIPFVLSVGSEGAEVEG